MIENKEETLFSFAKMHGAGNDFVVGFSTPEFPLERFDAQTICFLCDRRNGVGADGMLLLTPLAEPGRFHMDFYNRDGSRAGMCGNGLRCAALFVHRHAEPLAPPPYIFETDSGILTAQIVDGEPICVRITIRVNEPFRRLETEDGITVYFGVAGVPHAILPVPDPDAVDVAALGRFLRSHPAFGEAGTNVDFIGVPGGDGICKIRTYERGVEAETPACGTGIASAGWVLHQFFQLPDPIRFRTRSGAFITTQLDENKPDEILLTGPAVEVFNGKIHLPRRD